MIGLWSWRADIDDAAKEIVYRNYVDISVAVSSPNGLVVPVLRNVEDMGEAIIEVLTVAQPRGVKGSVLHFHYSSTGDLGFHPALGLGSFSLHAMSKQKQVPCTCETCFAFFFLDLVERAPVKRASSFAIH